MEKVQRNFELYKIAEIALLALGIALSYVFKKNVFVYGIAIGLIIQSAVMLVADLFAEARGATYLEQVRAITSL